RLGGSVLPGPVLRAAAGNAGCRLDRDLLDRGLAVAELPGAVRHPEGRDDADGHVVHRDPARPARERRRRRVRVGHGTGPAAVSGAGPITYGDPTTLAINAELSGEKLEVAQSFLDYIVSEECSKALAGIGITPSYFSDEVVDTIFSLGGMPDDDLSHTAFADTEVEAENPVGEFTNDIVTILEDTHSEILTGSTPVDEALTKAEEQLENEGLTA